MQTKLLFWDILYDFECTNQDFLKRGDMISCYACFAILPSSDFNYWAEKRLTEIDKNGMPLQGVCFDPVDQFHRIFHLVMSHEVQRRRIRDEWDLVCGCQSYLFCTERIKEGM